MGNPKGVRRDFDALERRRFEAIKLLDQGRSHSAVARLVGVSHTSVSRWAKTRDAQGKAGLRQAGRAGRKPLLSKEDRKRLKAGLLKGPEALGYETPVWTLWRVADLIEQEFKARYHPGHVWKILRQLDGTCQRPQGRARERNEKVIRRWKRVEWPRLKKKPKKRDAPSSSSTRRG